MTVAETAGARVDEQELLDFLNRGGTVERLDQMTEPYRRALRNFVLIQVDNEIFTYFNYAPFWRQAPDRPSRMGVLSVLKDELAHIQIGLNVLEDLGEDKHHLLYERAPEEWRATFSTQFTLRDFVDLAVSIAFVDRAGAIVIEDSWKKCSYGPYRRSLRRAALDQRFHQTWGFALMEMFARHSPATKRRLQESVDVIFPLTVEHFGTPDLRGDEKYLRYRIKGKTSEQYRQIWLDQVVPFLNRIDIDVPATRNDDGTWSLDFDWPVAFDEETETFDYERGVDWDVVFARWKRGGPGRRRILSQLHQGGHRVLEAVQG